jgi:hypothetical protein
MTQVFRNVWANYIGHGLRRSGALAALVLVAFSSAACAANNSAARQAATESAYGRTERLERDKYCSGRVISAMFWTRATGRALLTSVATDVQFPWENRPNRLFIVFCNSLPSQRAISTRHFKEMVITQYTQGPRFDMHDVVVSRAASPAPYPNMLVVQFRAISVKYPVKPPACCPLYPR